MSPIKSFVDYHPDSQFPLENLPWCIFSSPSNPSPRVGVAIGEKILDLATLSSVAKEIFEHETCPIVPERAKALFYQPCLNLYMSESRDVHRSFRSFLQSLLSLDGPLRGYLQDRRESLHAQVLLDQTEATLHLPVRVGDYTDFYLSKEHAFNCGALFRSKENAIQPNWWHIPVGYHGRASSIVPSGTPIHRPAGQYKLSPTDAAPVLGSCMRLDYELEMAFFVGGGEQGTKADGHGEVNELGQPINIREAESYIFGAALLNDWSARDIQAWEYVPLGPFNGKNFGSTISPWIVELSALEPFRVAARVQEPGPLEYLREEKRSTWDINLKVEVKGSRDEEWTTTTESNLKYMYWTMTQALTHHSIGGCNLRVGDMLGTGTISGPEEKNWASLLEKNLGGKREWAMRSGERRTWLQDGDSVRITGLCQGEGFRVGFGEALGKVESCKVKF
ncbi:Fumarylacetoacetase [Violaceomyces palustris]|uniref:Fumarylacetoacetase n=1 Tax=Violaceomyces palustris TaxID=1673888 RepID=A0ACD0P3E5_9BASI|nr:Fumarylacetoacetase [Violaceomyces palustris]